MKRFALLLVLAAGWPVAAAPATTPLARPARPRPAVERVVVVSVDGLRPDCLLLAPAPVMRGLMQAGAYTLWARTTAIATTLPSHASMLTGVEPRRHGIEGPRVPPLLTPAYPAQPTVMELAARAGYTTAMVAGKASFAIFNPPGSTTIVSLPKTKTVPDAEVAARAEEVIARHPPDLLVVHFAGVDAAGHKYGWGSPEQLTAIAVADAQIGRVLSALERAGVRDRAVVILTADHGGGGLGHGRDDARSRQIPWVIHGPGVRRGFDLTRVPDLQVDTEDTAATVCWLLGLQPPAPLDGHEVTAAFASAD